MGSCIEYFVLSLLTSNFWRTQLISQFGRPLPNPRRLPAVWVVFILPNNLLLVRPESSVQHQEEKWLLQTTERSNGSTKSAIFTWTNFTNCRFKFASFGNICIVCPVLFELVWWPIVIIAKPAGDASLI